MAQTLYSPLTQSLTVPLTSAQILAMTTAINVIPAPGVGKAIVVDQILFEMTTTATVYANGGVLTFFYTGGTSTAGDKNVVHVSSIPATIVNAAAGTSNTLLTSNTVASGVVIPANTGVDVINITAPFITGTGTASIQFFYRIVTL